MVHPYRTKAALVLLTIKRAGYGNGMQLVEFIDEWRRCVDFYGRGVSVDEFAGWTKRYARTRSFQLLKLFRQTFPQLGPQGTPQGLMGPLLERLASEEVSEDLEQELS